MKKTTLILAMIFGSFFLITKSDAQVRVGLNINIGNQPVWGPTGYDYVDYYYMPDIDAYYYVPDGVFIYLDGSRWVRSRTLPARYRNYDLYHGYKVVINQPNPYLHDNIYRSKYANYRGRHDQMIIRDSHDSRYFQIKDHPEHNKWNGNDRGNHYGNDRGNRGNERGNNYGNGHDRRNDNNDHNRGNDNNGRDRNDRGRERHNG